MPKKIPTDENESLKIPDVKNPRFSYAGGKILTELYGIIIVFTPLDYYKNNLIFLYYIIFIFGQLLE